MFSANRAYIVKKVSDFSIHRQCQTKHSLARNN
jgi:hypothetical protein